MTSGSDPLAFLKLMPGFDFMRQFAQAATGKNATPDLTEWVTPTTNAQEIDKRIANLKAVQGWLEQNVQVLGATVQALEIQKMTLSVLQGMNLNQAEIAKAFTAPKQTSPAPAANAGTMPETPVKVDAAQPAAPVAEPEPAPAAQKTVPASTPADPLQWWEGLTRQFQTISTNALREATLTLPPFVPSPPTHPVPAPTPVHKSVAPPARKSAAASTAKPGAKQAAPKKPKPAKPAARRGAA